MQYKNILVAVDTSDEADEVLKAAINLVNTKVTKISLITVIRPLTDFYIDLYAMLGDPEGLETQAIERACDWLTVLERRNDIQAESIEVVVGSLASEIHKFAQKISADLIVLGTHGQHGVALMLGSTANSVMHGSPCDVLAVRVKGAGTRNG